MSEVSRVAPGGFTIPRTLCGRDCSRQINTQFGHHPRARLVSGSLHTAENSRMAVCIRSVNYAVQATLDDPSDKKDSSKSTGQATDINFTDSSGWARALVPAPHSPPAGGRLLTVGNLTS